MSSQVFADMNILVHSTYFFSDPCHIIPLDFSLSGTTIEKKP